MSSVSGNVEKPLALVIRPDVDANLYLPSVQYDIQEISNTYQVVVKTLSNSFLWGETIRDTVREHKRRIQLLCVFTHGTESNLSFGSLNGESLFKIADLCMEDFEPLANDAVILLYACATGLLFALHMAIISRRVVIASKDAICDCRTAFFMAGPGQPRFVSYDEKDNQLMHLFSPKGVEFPITISEKTKKELFSRKLEYLKTLALASDKEAQYALALALLRGVEKAESSEESIQWLRLAAEQGESRSQAVLGRIYARGIYGVSQSDEEAARWSRLAAERGEPIAQYEMGLAYYRGLYQLPKSDEEALHWFQLAADLRRINSLSTRNSARFMVGKFYEKGRGGLTASDREAFFWYHAAAEQGFEKAQCKVGFFYATGRGGFMPSGLEAIRWFHMAAKEGMAKAQYFLGLSYETGLCGVSRSPKNAVSWYRLAASQGEPRAIEALKFFTKKT